VIPETEQKALRARVAELEQALESAQHAAETDALTGCLNRRGWERALEREEDRCRRHDLPATVVIVDLDSLKEINDGQGHDAGDDLIRGCARVLRATVRIHDTVARLGGDEFGVLATHSGDAGAPPLKQRLVTALAAARIDATLGAAVRTEFAGLREAWQVADRRMVEAKRAARSS
jgi:diguanylate cyclase (GGDEF)-like protein